MDTAINSRKFGPAALHRINYCRMYLNVLLLSDITSPNGKHIDNAAYTGDRDAMPPLETLHSVHQTKPNDKAWAEWRKCLNLLCHSNHSHLLKEQLGAWIVRPPNYARNWPFLYPPQEDAIYRSTALDYSVH